MNEVLARDVTDAGSTPARSTILMKIIILILLIHCIGCSNQSTADYQVYDNIIQQDLDNKQYELEILRELFVAQLNNDEDAFTYYVSEYIRVPRLKLTEKQKNHPRYKPWITDEIIKSGDFMDEKYNYK